MKSIKYFLSISLFLGSIVSNAQYYTFFCPDWVNPNNPTNECITSPISLTTVSTPNYSQVDVYKVYSDWAQNTKNNYVGYWQGQYGKRLILEEEATTNYNCHAWAWAGITTHWMNPPEEQKYFSVNDLSYVPTTNTAIATKVWYGGSGPNSADHSAVTTSSAGYFSSKWWAGPRFKHLINDSPYNTSNLQYFIRSAISGPDYVCFSSNYYLNFNGTVSSWSLSPSGSVFTEPPFTLTPNGNSATVTATPMNDGRNHTCNLYATVNGVTISKTLTMCALVGADAICLSSIYGINNGEYVFTWSITNNSMFSLTPINSGFNAEVTALSPMSQSCVLTAVAGNGKTFTVPITACQGAVVGPPNVCTTATYYLNLGQAVYWTKGGDGITIVSSNSTSATVLADPAYTGQTMAVIAVTSGGGIVKNVLISCAKGAGSNDTDLDIYVSAYPNPVSNILYIEIDALAHSSDLQARSLNSKPVYTIRLLDGQGNTVQNLQSKTGSEQLNVSNLSNGIYYLIVFDDLGSTPVVRSIIVKH
jgi:hypothetical protein